MSTRLLTALSFTCLLLTALWLALLIVGSTAAGELNTFEKTLAHVRKLDPVFYLTYVNASLITVNAVMLFAVLYIHYRRVALDWAAIGIAFVPIYGAMNLLVYLSQITIVPRLLHWQSVPDYQALSLLALQEVIQQWPSSSTAIVNDLAYAILGIPSIIFGVLMSKDPSVLRLGGVFLALSGVASIAGFVGIAAQSAWLSQGSLVGGILFLLALVLMWWGFGAGRTQAGAAG